MRNGDGYVLSFKKKFLQHYWLQGKDSADLESKEEISSVIPKARVPCVG